jgi:DNA-binding MarR family transcriptional regulator
MPQPLSSRAAAAQQLMFISGYVHRLLRHEAKQIDLRWTALMVLKDLQLLGPLSQRGLAEIEQVSAPTMTVLLRQMAEREWVRRAGTEGDARVSLVSITPTGRRKLKKAGSSLQARLEAELIDLPERVLDDLHESLGLLSAVVMKKIHGALPELK